VWQDPSSREAEPLLTGSYLAGVALSFARLGIVHGLAHPLGALYHQPHGVVCAACLPYALELNRESFGKKYGQLGTALNGDPLKTIRNLSRCLDLKSPFAGLPLLDSERIVQETLTSGSTKANPRTITRSDVEWMLNRLFA
jgi:alcohol dehydrogenase class IV